VSDPYAAYRSLAGDGGDALCREVQTLVDEASRVPVLLRDLRALLRREHRTTDLAAAALALGKSTRTLQRVLGEHGTSFQGELREARFVEACAALGGTEEKVAAVASRLGITEGSLTQLLRERTGHTPSEYRRLQRR
jgi:AraC-like DNA-binding protein